MEFNEKQLEKIEILRKKIPNVFFQIPLSSMSSSTMEKIKFLDCNFILPGDSVKFRDFRGLAVLQGCDTMEFNYLIDQKRYNSPTVLILEKMKDKKKSLGDLILCLQQLKRRDILANIKESCEEDVKNYQKISTYENTKNYSEDLYNEIVTQKEEEEDKMELEKIFTTDIISTTKQKIEIYDIFISFDSESISDIKIMWELSQLLEERSLTVAKGSYSFIQSHISHNFFATAIFKRSKKVILLISKSFIRSKTCVMQMNFAKESDKAAWNRKVVPIYIENVKKPECISGLNCFNYYEESIRKDVMPYFLDSMKG